MTHLSYCAPAKAHYTYFASGSNQAGEIEGFAALGACYGVAVPDVNEESLLAIELNAVASESFVFVDSGAFGEFKSGVEITDAEWERRLSIYSRLAMALDDKLYCVAPDKIADQLGTMLRLDRYRCDVNRLSAMTGGNIIVPLQGDPDGLTLAEMDAWVQETLPGVEYVRGIPSNANPASVKDIIDLVVTLPPFAKVHLLGIGPKAGAKFVDRLQAIKSARPDVKVLCDSVLLTSMAGKGRAVTEEHNAFWYEELAPKVFEEDFTDYSDNVGEMDAWMTPAYRRRLFEELCKCGIADDMDRPLINRSPEGFFELNELWLNDWACAIVDELYVGVTTKKGNGYVFTETVNLRKFQTVVRACGPLYDAFGAWIGGFGRLKVAA